MSRPSDPTTDKPRTLRRSLTVTFTLVSLLSVLLLGVLNYWQTRGLLTESVNDRLVNQQRAKAVAIRNGVDRLEQSVVIAANDQEVIAAVGEFSSAYLELAEAELLDADQSDAVSEFYDSLADAIVEAGVDSDSFVTGDLEPTTDVGRYLQYHYIVQNPSDPEQRNDMVTAAGDDSVYGELHTAWHPALDRLRTQLGLGDLLLIDTIGNVVYSTSKRLDFATNTASGPYRDTGMGDAVTSGIAAAAVGDAVFVDFELYLPAAGKPALFVAAAVRARARTVGTLLVEVPVGALNQLTVGALDWIDTGFGDTAEIYVVGRDQLMRTDSRLWLEDPVEYQRILDDVGAEPLLGDLIETFGSTVLLQEVQTEAVAEALDGEQFLGGGDNYLGRRSLTSAGPVGSDKVDWVVVAEVATSEANAPLRSYLVRILVVGLVLIPIVGLAAMFFADRMTKPVEPVVAAAAAVAGGDLTTTVPDLGRNEFGDVGRRLNLLTSELRAKEKALAAEESEIERLLLSALPTRLVSALREGDRKLLDLVDTATIIAFDIEGIVDVAGMDDQVAVELSADFSAEVESIAERLGVERIRSSTDQHLFASGLDSPDTEIALAVEFTVEVIDAISVFNAEHGVDISYRVGMSAGEVIAGLLAAEQLTYGVFGEPPRTALALAGIAASNQVIVDATTAADLGDEWELDQASDLIDLRGSKVAALVLKGRASQAQT
ncbi:MAG: HAMP domain-containing protein [bacterium]|nr:HAMP domain-containing protein [bacterium]